MLTLISVFVPSSVLPQQHVKLKDPSHSAKGVGGSLHHNTHAPYVCGLA